jgi:hypothetical protein
MLFIIIIGGILVLFIYITRLASNGIFSPSNKIHREVDRAKDLSAPLYIHKLCLTYSTCRYDCTRMQHNGDGSLTNSLIHSHTHTFILHHRSSPTLYSLIPVYDKAIKLFSKERDVTRDWPTDKLAFDS